MHPMKAIAHPMSVVISVVLLVSALFSTEALGTMQRLSLDSPVTVGTVDGEAFLLISLPVSTLQDLTDGIDEAILTIRADPGASAKCLAFYPYNAATDTLGVGAFTGTGVARRMARSACASLDAAGASHFSISLRRVLSGLQDVSLAATGLLIGGVCEGGASCRLPAEVIDNATSDPGAWSARIDVWSSPSDE